MIDNKICYYKYDSDHSWYFYYLENFCTLRAEGEEMCEEAEQD